MSMLNVFQVAGSALHAQSLRLNTTASNLANADSVVSSDGQPYRAKQVVFAARPVAGPAAVGVQVGGVVDLHLTGGIQVVALGDGEAVLLDDVDHARLHRRHPHRDSVDGQRHGLACGNRDPARGRDYQQQPCDYQPQHR